MQGARCAHSACQQKHNAVIQRLFTAASRCKTTPDCALMPHAWMPR
jgi:hypothetical protein